MRTTIILVLAVALIGVGAFIYAETITGRTLVTNGELKTLEGTFTVENSEWYVTSGNNKYLIHKGPIQYHEEKKISLQPNSTIKVYGYVYKNEITPVTITSQNVEYKFRDQYGRPLWSGRGYGLSRRK